MDVSNNLGIFLTKNGIQNVDLYVKTSISTSKLSQLRNGVMKTILDKDLYLIAKASNIPIEKMLLGTYPFLQLKENKEELVTLEDMKSLEDFFKKIERDVIKEISTKTSLKVDRIKAIRKNTVSAKAHELYLIELATNVQPGTLFKIKYRNIELNPPEVQIKLRQMEIAKNRKK